jgi:hypothetical protein
VTVARPKAHDLHAIYAPGVRRTLAGLLAAVGVLLVVETHFAGSTAFALPPDQILRAVVGLIAGVAVGAISSPLGVAGVSSSFRF